MNRTKVAFATDDPKTLTVYREVLAARHEFGGRLRADALALGHNLGALVHKVPGGGEEIIGLKPDGSGEVPDGWRMVNNGKRLSPAITRAGDQARRWLAQHQPPAGSDPVEVLKDHGLVAHSRVGDIYNYTDYRPVIFEYDGRLWACYLGKPIADDGGEPTGLTWPQVPIEDCLVAQARAAAAPTAHLN